MSKEVFGEDSKCRIKKQEAKRKKKKEQEKLEGKSHDFRDGGLEDAPPPSKKISGNCVFAQSDTTQDVQFYLEFREKKARSSQLVQCNTKFRKKQDPLKIVLSCKVVNCKDVKKILFFLFSKLTEYD